MAHYSTFPDKWWDERRKRDFWIDEEGEVRGPQVGSPTGIALEKVLMGRAAELADDAKASIRDKTRELVQLGIKIRRLRRQLVAVTGY